jgi:hypothetical protein
MEVGQGQNVGCSAKEKKILSRVLAIKGFWIDNWIYLPFTSRNYK